MPLDAAKLISINLWTILKEKITERERGEDAFTLALWYVEASLHKYNLSEYSILANFLQKLRDNNRCHDFNDCLSHWIEGIRQEGFLQSHHLVFQSSEDMITSGETATKRRDLHLFDNNDNWGLVFEFKVTTEIAWHQLKGYLHRIRRSYQSKNLCGILITKSRENLQISDPNFPISLGWGNYYDFLEITEEMLQDGSNVNLKAEAKVYYQILHDSLTMLLAKVPRAPNTAFRLKIGERFQETSDNDLDIDFSTRFNLREIIQKVSEWFPDLFVEERQQTMNFSQLELVSKKNIIQEMTVDFLSGGSRRSRNEPQKNYLAFLWKPSDNNNEKGYYILNNNQRRIINSSITGNRFDFEAIKEKVKIWFDEGS